MTNRLQIPAGERGVVRLFALDMRPEQAAFLKDSDALAQVLGVADIDMEQVEIFPVSDLEDIGLTGYLREGLGVPLEQLEADREMLEGLEGHVLLIRSPAFRGEAARLTPASQITLLATYEERPTDWRAAPMSAESAKPFSASRMPPKHARAKAQRIGAILFAVGMLLIVLLVWALLA